MVDAAFETLRSIGRRLRGRKAPATPLSPPLEQAPHPDTPKSAFRVRTENPAEICALVKDDVQRGENKSFQLNRATLGGLFRDTQTELWSGKHGLPLATYFFISEEEARQRPDSGYYSQGRIKELQEILEQKGYACKPTEGKIAYQGKVNDLVFQKDGISFSLRLGFGSREDDEGFLKKEAAAQRERKEIAEDGTTVAERDLKHRAPLTNPFVSLRALSPLPVADTGVFERHMQTFATVYQDVVRTLYQEAVTAIPNMPKEGIDIVLSAPTQPAPQEPPPPQIHGGGL